MKNHITNEHRIIIKENEIESNDEELNQDELVDEENRKKKKKKIQNKLCYFYDH